MSASEDGQIKIWDLRTSQCQREIHNNISPSQGLFSAGRTSITAAALHPDQSKVVSADVDGCVRVWDIGTRGCLSELCVCKLPVPISMLVDGTGRGKSAEVGEHIVHGRPDSCGQFKGNELHANL